MLTEYTFDVHSAKMHLFLVRHAIHIDIMEAWQGLAMGAFLPSIPRKACPYVMPCEPAISCIGNGKCAPGYMSYYELYQSNGLCDPLHYTLPDSTCFAPRCGMCDISDETHFRLDGLCVHARQSPG